VPLRRRIGTCASDYALSSPRPPPWTRSITYFVFLGGEESGESLYQAWEEMYRFAGYQSLKMLRASETDGCAQLWCLRDTANDRSTHAGLAARLVTTRTLREGRGRVGYPVLFVRSVLFSARKTLFPPPGHLERIIAPRFSRPSPGETPNGSPTARADLARLARTDCRRSRRKREPVFRVSLAGDAHVTWRSRCCAILIRSNGANRWTSRALLDTPLVKKFVCVTAG